MHKRNTSAQGFTIVELLIVIVVIAILAAISIIAFTGIQNRGYDSAIQSDLNNFAKKIQLHHAEHGEYPAGGSDSGNAATFPGMRISVTKGAYASNVDNLHYCRGMKSGNTTFAVTARSKSMKLFIYTPETGMTSLPSGSPYGSCVAGFDGGVSAISRSYGYYSVSDLWFPWTE